MKTILRFCCAALLLAVHTLAAALPQQLTSSMADADYADVRTDAAGSIHLVWTAYDATDGRALFYKMLNSSGDVLIDAIRLDQGGTGGPAMFPSLAIDAARKVYVVWQTGASPEIYFLRLNPLAHDFSTTTADIATIKETGDVMISGAGGDSALHPRVEMDNSTRLHVVWESDCAGGKVQYAKLDADGNRLNGTPFDLGPAGSCNGYPDIALDSNSNAHVVFSNAGATPADEIYYAMIDGAAGTVLIDATLLTVDDGLLAGSATISINTVDNRAYLVYKQAVGSSGPGNEEIFIDTLDPSLDGQGGGVADPAVLRVKQQQFSNGQGGFWHVFSRIGQDRRLHILSMDFDAAVCTANSVNTIHHAHVTYGGKVLLRENLSTTTQSCAASVRLAPRGDRIVWADSASGNQEIFSTTFTRADAGSSGFTCALQRAPGRAANAADLWLLLAGIAVLGLRVARRRQAA